MTPAETRARHNPLLGLPAMQRLQQQPQLVRDLLADLLADLAADAGRRADNSWRRHKAPMAAYWKAVAVYARHTRRALRAPRNAVQSGDGGVIITTPDQLDDCTKAAQLINRLCADHLCSKGYRQWVLAVARAAFPDCKWTVSAENRVLVDKQPPSNR